MCWIYNYTFILLYCFFSW